jgi:hypothetical protein
MGEKGVTVEIQGRPHEVPQGVTILQAYWSAGEELIHGVGCLRKRVLQQIRLHKSYKLTLAH